MKKFHKFFAVLVALAMMATMAVTMSFAEVGAPALPDTTTAPIKKDLVVPEGTKVPDGAYATYSFSNPKVNGADAEEGEAVLAEKKIEFTDAFANKDEKVTKYQFQNIDVYHYTFEDALSDFTFTRPGVYTWNVEEKEFFIDDGDKATTDVPTKDPTTYTLVAKVVSGEDGSLKIEDVNVKSGSDSSDDQTKEIAGLSFRNYYYTTTGNPGEKEDPENPGETVEDPTKPGDKDNDGAGLSIEKEVTGTYGDKNTPFEITVNVALPQMAGANTASAVIRRANGDVETVEIKNRVNTVVKLAHGDRLVFTKIAEGAKYTVKETDSRKGTKVEQYTATGEVETAKAVVKAANAEKIVNKSNQDETTPTGILINNLPYIALALVAIGGIVAYVVARRREDEND